MFSEWMLTDKSQKYGAIPGWAMPTGIVLWIVLTVLTFFSVRKVNFKIQ